MEFGIFLKAIAPIKNLFGWIFKKRKLTILLYRKMEEVCYIIGGEKNPPDKYSLCVSIKNNTSSPIILKEIKYGEEEWGYIYEEPFTIYPDTVENSNSENRAVELVVEHGIYTEHGNMQVQVRDINNKIHKSKYVDTQFWVS